MASSDFSERAITLHLATQDAILLDGVRSWRASLILSELITNASRHAFGPKGGKISTAVSVTQGLVVCRVSDDGKSASTPRAGLGTQLIDAIAADIEGNVERCFTKEGSVVTLKFPKETLHSPQSVFPEGTEHHNDISNASFMR
jgi:two-component sensor histidine kinase